MSANGGHQHPAGQPRERGFALIAVLLVLALIGTLGAEFAFSMRLEASAVRNYKETVTATHLAEAGLAQAMREIAAVMRRGSLSPRTTTSPSTRGTAWPCRAFRACECPSAPATSLTG